MKDAVDSTKVSIKFFLEEHKIVALVKLKKNLCQFFLSELIQPSTDLLIFHTMI